MFKNFLIQGEVSGKFGSKARFILTYFLLISYTLVAITPAVFGLISSFKTQHGIMGAPLKAPINFQWSNYLKAWYEGNFSIFFKNSLIVTSLSVTFSVLFSSMAAYVLARFNFPGDRFFILFFLAGLFIPFRLAVLPVFILLRNLNLYDTLWGLVLVYLGTNMPFSIFILVNFFKGIPSDIEESARIDGASHLRIYWSIILPLIKPALVTVALINFIWNWNDFFLPLVLIQSQDLQTLPLGISSFFGEYQNQWNLILAGINITIVPVIILYLFASRQFIEGLTAGARK